MFRFTYFRQAIRASKYSKAALAVLLTGMIASALVAANGLTPAGAASGALTCSGPSTGVVNQPSTFTATGGNGSYSWVSAQSRGTGASYTVAFPNPGDKAITVMSGNETATCNIHINDTGTTGGGSTTGTVSCSGPTQLAPNETGTFTATGGNGSYHWVSAQSVADGQTYRVSFPNAGDKAVTVTSNGQTATCNVHVSSTLPPTPGAIACSGPSTLSVNQNGTFTATGGNGSYHWVSAQSVADGPSYTVNFPNVGLKTINVSSGGQTGSCSVNVTDNGGGNPGPNPGSATCGAIQYSAITVSGGQARATVTNPLTTAANCGKDVTLASYQAFVDWNGSNNNEYLNGQRLFGQQTVHLVPGQTATVSVSLPTCNYQVDLFNGTTPKVPPFYGAELMTWKQEFNAGTCRDIPHTPTLSCAPGSQTVNMNQNASFYANGGDGTYSWNVSGGSPSIGSGPTFNTSFSTAGNRTVTVTSGGQTAYCTVNVPQIQVPQVSCSPASQNANLNQTVSFTATGGTGSFAWTGGGSPTTGGGSSFSTSYGTTGTHTVTVTSGGRSATCSVYVPPVDHPTLSCSPSSQNVNLNQSANFVATGGNGTYNWSVSGGNPSTGSGANFSSSFSTTGTRYVTVTSDGMTAQCAVNVNDIVVPNLVCTPNSQSVNVGNYASFSVTGGSGSYNWSAPNGSPTYGSGSNFTSQFWNQGNFSIVVHDSAGRSATCNVNVTQNYNPQYPSCSPSTQNAGVGQQVSFYGNGGTGNFTWNAPNAVTNYGYGSVFTTSFNSPGYYNVTLNSNGQTATCSVNVQQNITNVPFCTPSTQNAEVGSFVSFNAQGGNGSYFWNTSSGDGLPSNGSGPTFGTRFSTAGTKIVTVNSNGVSSQCIVQIGAVLGASTIVTGPTDGALWAMLIGLLGSAGAYGFVQRKTLKAIIASLVARA